MLLRTTSILLNLRYVLAFGDADIRVPAPSTPWHNLAAVVCLAGVIFGRQLSVIVFTAVERGLDKN
jgi:hypothetical protein